MANKKKEGLKVTLSGTIIEAQTAKETYLKVFNILFEKGLINQNILQDFPSIVRSTKAAWGTNQQFGKSQKIVGSTNLFITPHSSTLAKSRQLNAVFKKYNITGNALVVSSNPQPQPPVPVPVPVPASRITNRLSQALCIIGDSGVGKSTRIEKTLENENHKTLYVIVDSMWQHLLFDYDPENRKYIFTKISKFIKDAFNTPKVNHTIIFDECHKNLELINDVLLQAISIGRNNGKRFISLNTSVDSEFSFLEEKNGYREIPNNLGFMFISSKSDVILEGNSDLRNRVKIVELTKEDQDKEFTLDYLFHKVLPLTSPEQI